MTKYLHKTAHDVREAGMLSAHDRAKSAQHLSKDEVASETPHNLHLVSRAYENALSLQLAPTGARGYMSIYAVLFLVGTGFWLYWAHDAFVLLHMTDDQPADLWTFLTDVLVGVMLISAFAFSSIAIRAFRIELFGPKDIPLVFNRKTRKVYKFVPQMPERDLGNPVRIFKYWLTAFQPWPPMLLIEYDWDCLEAEYFEVTQPMGRVVKTLHVLQFYVKERPDSNWVIGSFTLASPLLIGRSMAMDLWEFLRRYMEEDGPVMHKGDTPAPAYPSNLLQSAQAMLPGVWPLMVVGAAWAGHFTWKYGYEGLVYGDYGFLASAVGFICGMSCLSMVFNWISHFFSRDTELPPQMLAGAGEPLDLHALSNRANAAESSAPHPAPSSPLEPEQPCPGSARAPAARLTQQEWLDRCKDSALERMKALAQARGGCCLSEQYTGAGRYRFRCAQGHEWMTSSKRLFDGGWCRLCKREAGCKEVPAERSPCSDLPKARMCPSPQQMPPSPCPSPC